MVNKRIIFAPSVTGHNLEYIHHLYMGYLTKKDECLIFVIPELFNKQKELFHWPQSTYISFDLMSMAEVGNLDDSWYKKQLRFSLLLRKYIKKHNATTAFVIDLMSMMPFLPCLIWRSVKISGIIYGIYLYRWEELSIHRKLSEIIWHTLLVKRSIFEKIYVLNDRGAALYLNKIYNTDKFKFLPDPYVPLEVPYKDLRIEYNIPISKKIFFHFGSMGYRKGTLLILESILQMSQSERDKYVFVIAGIIQGGIKDQFYDILQRIGDSATILVFDYFNSFETIANWCQNADAILIPYLSSYQSSGIIGYAAQYKKPVITTNKGLVGKLVRKYHLGITLDPVNCDSLIQAYNDIENWENCNSKYLDHNNVDKFFKVLSMA